MINRFIPFNLGNIKLKRNRYPKRGKLPKELTDKVRILISGLSKSLPNTWATISDVVVNKDAEELIWQYSDKMDATDHHELSLLRKRRFENCLRLCVVMAGWSEEKVISLDIAKFAIHILKDNCEQIDNAIVNRHVMPDYFDRVIPPILKFIKKHKNGITKTDLFDNCKEYKNLKKKKSRSKEARDEVLDEMVDRNLIEMVKETGNGKRPTTFIKSI